MQTKNRKRRASVAEVVAALPQNFQTAVDAYAKANGPSWSQKLMEDWIAERDTNFPEHGSMLRQLRCDPEHGLKLMRAIFRSSRRPRVPLMP